jgi:hypothetical protein
VIKTVAPLVTVDGDVVTVQLGDVITVAVDLDGFKAYFAINGVLLVQGDKRDSSSIATSATADDPRNRAATVVLAPAQSPTSPVRAATASRQLSVHGFPIPVHLAGMLIVPVLATAGGKATTQFTSPEVECYLLEVAGFLLLGARRARVGDAARATSLIGASPPTTAIQARHQHSTRTAYDSDATHHTESGGDILMEAFLLSIGCRPHYHACTKRHWWSALSESVDSDCAICMLALNMVRFAF